MPKTWVYKCNRDESANLAFGAWEDVFHSMDVIEWGGSDCTSNPMSKNILNEKMHAGDLIFAYQSDEKNIVGTCRVKRMEGERNERRIFLQPLKWFDNPVPFFELKARNPNLKDIRAFTRRFRGTFYPVSPYEGRLLAEVCGVDFDRPALASETDDADADPTDLPPGKYPEGSTKRVVVNAYERSASARKACIAKHGFKCVVCKFDFVKRYGNLGKGFIHVHHLKLLSKVGPNYRIDPVKDLRPVCPNCHAMLHKSKSKLLSINELKALLRE